MGAECNRKREAWGTIPPAVMGCGEGVTAVPPPHPTTKKNGRHCRRPCPTFTSYARQKPADGRTPTTKKHGRHC
ncbi:MAG: hypothetical protein HND44_24810 [Chloroflexi bacterium]|nr:hypothetical protein [Ardenticatenaceae bacterium]NOG37756.1 hypothetical protein [Chloroflexota bacterium]